MYITCEQCSTIFRLDENLLNPTGSKVRCSQCRNIFVVTPPVIPEAQPDAFDTPAVPSNRVQGNLDQGTDQFDDTFDRELEGIDLSELDSIMEEGRSVDSDMDAADQSQEEVVDVLADFDDADLDMDFESALEKDTADLPQKQHIPEAPAPRAVDPIDTLGNDLDLDMNFELDSWDEELSKPPSESQVDDLEVDMNMDFNLDDGLEETVAVESPKASVIDEGTDTAGMPLFNENVELALDDFEDVLGGAEGQESGDLQPVDAVDKALDTDALSADETMEMPLDTKIDSDSITALDAAGEQAGDLDLTGLDALLDDGPENIDTLGQEAELSLDDDVEMSPEPVGEQSAPTAPMDSSSDDLDLADLDALLDGDQGEDLTESIVSQDDDDEELSLDDDFAVDAQADDDTFAIDAGGESDDLELGDLDALLDGDDDIVDTPLPSDSDGDETLMLDDDLDLSLDEDATIADVTDDADTLVSADSGSDDFDLEDLDALLDGDDDNRVQASQASGDEALSLDDEMAFSLDEDATMVEGTDESAAPVSADKEQDDFDFGDIDNLLDDGEDQTDTIVSSGDNETLSQDDDLELSLDDGATLVSGADDAGAAMPAGSDSEGIDLGDLDDLLDDDEDQTETVVSNEDDALSLDDELDFSLDEEATLIEKDESVEEVSADGADPGLDLGDLDGLLDADNGSAEAGKAPEDESGEFDLSDLEGLMDEDESPQAADEDELELTMALDDELELSLDDEAPLQMDSDEEAQSVSSADGDDFDISKLEETVLDGGDTSQSEASDDDLELSLDDEFDLSLDDELEAAGVSDDKDELDDLEDLDFELDTDFDEKTIAQSADEITLEDDQADEDLDLTDIEQMLEDDTIVPDKADAAGLGGDEAGQWGDAAGDDLGMSDDEIDLSELEEAIDEVDGTDKDEPFADEQELELELELDPAEGESSDEADEFDLKLEMEDDLLSAPDSLDQDGDDLEVTEMDLTLENEPAVLETDTVDAGDIQLEFRIEETSGQSLGDQSKAVSQTSQTAISATSGFMTGEDDFSGEETIATAPPIEQPAVGAPPPVKSSRSNKTLLIIIPVLLLAMVLGYFGYNLAKKNDIRIPFISDYLNPKPKDPSGVLRLSTMEINGKFIENETAGRLFVITGKVRNDYSMARKLVRLKGKLYAKGKKLVKTEQAFAGLVISDQELASSSIMEIKKRLNATAGQDAAVIIEADKSTPFMVVFSDLPTDLDEYVIELISSIKVQ